MGENKFIISVVEKYKYPLIILAIGAVLMLIPFGTPEDAQSNDALIQQVLSAAAGIGRARVMSSEKGIVILCEGADSPQVRLDIINAVSSYTGFGSDKITILKMAEQ